MDAKIAATGDYVGLGVCKKEVEVPLLVECRLTYPNITKYIRIPPLVRWSYRYFNQSKYMKLNADPMHSTAKYSDICLPEDNHTYLCTYRHEFTCTRDFEGYYKCDVTVETSDGKERVFTDDVIVCESFIF